MKLSTAQHLMPMFRIISGIHAFMYVDRGSVVVKVLCYKSEGRWFSQWIFH